MVVKGRHYRREVCQGLRGYDALVWRHSAIGERHRQSNVSQRSTITDMDTAEESMALRGKDGNPLAGKGMEGMSDDNRIDSVSV